MMAETNGLKRYLVATATAITTALVLQSGVLAWWGGTISARMDNVERTINKIDTRVMHLEREK